MKVLTDGQTGAWMDNRQIVITMLMLGVLRVKHCKWAFKDGVNTYGTKILSRALSPFLHILSQVVKIVDPGFVRSKPLYFCLYSLHQFKLCIIGRHVLS